MNFCCARAKRPGRLLEVFADLRWQMKASHSTTEPLPGRMVLKGLRSEFSSVTLSLARLHLQLEYGIVRPETRTFCVHGVYTEVCNLSLRALGVTEGS